MSPLPSTVKSFKPDHKLITQLHGAPEKLDLLFSDYWQQTAKKPTSGSLSCMQIDQILLGYLQQTGTLPALEKRAEQKQSELKQLNQRPDAGDLNELDRLQLSDWYFSSRLDMDMPDDIQAYIDTLGMHDVTDFYAMILEEFIYLEAV